MKKIHLFSGIAIMALLVMFASCQKPKEATLTVDFVDANSGWYGDEIKFKITVDSKETFSLNIKNNANDKEFNQDYSTTGTTNAEYTFVIPSGIEEGKKIDLTFTATTSEGMLKTTVVKTITVTTNSGGGGGNGKTVIHEGEISADENWSANDIHIIKGSFYINGCTVTIAPGTVISLGSDASINIGDNTPNSKVIAKGTADKPITFTSGLSEKNPGDWKYIHIDEGTLNSTIFEYCIFEYGGGDSYYNYMFGIDDCEISVNNCTFQKSKGYGIKVIDKAIFSSFESNTLKECAEHLVNIPPNAVHSLSNTSTYTSTGKGILINAYSSGTFSLKAATWYKQTVPYFLKNDLDIESTDGATLTLEAGSTLKMYADVNIEIGDNKSGALIAEGTDSEPITFTSALSEQNPGDWEYIWFDDNALNTSKLKYCVIEYAGGDNYYNFSLMLNGNNIEIPVDNCTIKHSKSNGIRLRSGAKFASFANNTISNCGKYLIDIQPNAVHTIGNNNTLTSIDYGVLIDDNANYTLTTEHSWPKLTCSYIVDGMIDVGTSDAGGAILRILPGATFLIKGDAGFDIGSSGYNSTIYFAGTADDPITFTSGFATQQAGQWKYLYFGSEIMPGSTLDHVKVSYGGKNSYYKGNIVIASNTNLTVKNCTITHSNGYGIYNMSGGHPKNADWKTVNTFNNNTSGNFNP